MILFFSECSTEKNTSLTRFYHNTTAHFNIFFNGFESFKKGERTIDETSENYTQMLPIFKNEREDIQASISSDMDEAIKKSVKMIKMHSITVKPERKEPGKGKRAYELTTQQKEFYNQNEYNKWVDDAYLLIGKAHYFKGDFQGGLKSLHLIINKFRKEEIRFHAMYWIARTYSATANYNDAENYLKLITDDKTHPKELDALVDLAYADIFIKKGKLPEAIEKLEYIITSTKKKNDRARLKFILAQLYQKQNQGDKAFNLYAEVVKMNPPYEMVFNAKINMAKSFLSGSKGSDEIRKILSKMLKDDKNIEFKDQIYYVLAGVEQKDGNNETALKYYHESLKASISNPNQKALTYLALADIYFDKRKYLQAGEYYDSTMTMLDKKYPDYDQISNKAMGLKGLTDNLKLIAREDSLQKIAKMDTVKRDEFIKAIIAQVIADEQAELNAGMSGYNDQFNRGEYNQNNTKGKWYFYNTQALSIGKSEFQKIWGKRVLEDHWRRKNKTVLSDGFEDDETNGQDSGRISDIKKPEYYLQDLPLTDSLMKLSNQRIAKAYFDAGVIYERTLKDYDEALKSYHRLIERYPNNDLVLEAIFNMYLLHYNITKNSTLAENNRRIILEKYPYSKYAKILSDPNYLTTLKQNKEKIDRIYEEAYKLHKDKKYPEVLTKIEEAYTIADQNHLDPKFMYLKSLALGNMGKTNEMEQCLKELVLKFPNEDVTPLAQNTLDLLASGKYNPDYYQQGRDSVYYLAYTFHVKDTAASHVKYMLTTYNAKTYQKENYKSELSELDKETSILLVKKFNNETTVLEYRNKLMGEEQFNSLFYRGVKPFVISQTNYQKLLKLPIVDKYMEFYKQYYQN
jgi:tetratricopeptide (TPR) repeat protein